MAERPEGGQAHWGGSTEEAWSRKRPNNTVKETSRASDSLTPGTIWWKET